METNYKQIKVKWISKRGFTTLILACVFSLLTAMTLPFTILFWQYFIVDHKLYIRTIWIISLVGVIYCFFGVILVHLLKMQCFNMYWKYILGIWFCVFGFIIIGVLMLLEKEAPKVEERNENPDFLEGYEPHYFLKRIDHKFKEDKKREEESDQFTYWVPPKTRKALTIAWYSQILLTIIVVIVSVILLLVFEGISIKLIAIFLLLDNLYFCTFNLLFTFQIKKRDWTTKATKVALTIGLLFSLNILGFYFMLSSKLGYCTDDYEKVHKSQTDSFTTEDLGILKKF